MTATSCVRRLLAAIALGLAVTAAPAAGQAQRSPVPPAELSEALAATVQRVLPSVLQIFTTSYEPGQRLLARPGALVTTVRASGSGVIVDADGYIVTNAHVVRSAARLRVEVPQSAAGGSILASRSRLVGAQVVGIDEETD